MAYQALKTKMILPGGSGSWILLASIPGRVFAFITVRRTTGPGTSCLRMRQIFIVYLWSAKIFNKSIIEICTQKMHRVSTQKMHIGSCFTQRPGELPVVLQHNYSDPGQLQDD